MAVKIQQVESQLNRDELDFFIKGNISLEKNPRRKPFDWLPDQSWEDIMKLTSVLPEKFGSLAEDVERGEAAWKEVREKVTSCWTGSIRPVCLLALFFLKVV